MSELFEKFPIIVEVLELRNVKDGQKRLLVDRYLVFPFLHETYSVEVSVCHFDYLFPQLGIVNFC